VRRVQQGEGIEQLETLWRRKDGRLIHLSENLVLLFLEHASL
jgi:hypothetical protein